MKIATKIPELRNKHLREELIEAYKSMSKEDLKILKEWESASKKVD